MAQRPPTDEERQRPPVHDGAAAEDVRRSADVPARGAPRWRTDEALRPRDLVRWGPIVAGVFVTITTMVVLTVLGVALGLSAFDPASLGDIDTAAWIWGIATGLIAFFLGGFVAARAASAAASAPLNGLMVGVTAIAAIVLLVGAGIGNALGAAATNIGAIAEVVRDLTVTPQEAEQAAQTAFEDAEGGAWGTFIGLVVALAAATAGGLLGRRPAAEDDAPAGDAH